jgi:hypothetical protein
MERLIRSASVSTRSARSGWPALSQLLPSRFRLASSPSTQPACRLHSSPRSACAIARSPSPTLPMAEDMFRWAAARRRGSPSTSAAASEAVATASQSTGLRRVTK